MNTLISPGTAEKAEQKTPESFTLMSVLHLGEEVPTTKTVPLGVASVSLLSIIGGGHVRRRVVIDLNASLDPRSWSLKSCQDDTPSEERVRFAQVAARGSVPVAAGGEDSCLVWETVKGDDHSHWSQSFVSGEFLKHRPYRRRCKKTDCMIAACLSIAGLIDEPALSLPPQCVDNDPNKAGASVGLSLPSKGQMIVPMSCLLINHNNFEVDGSAESRLITESRISDQAEKLDLALREAWGD